MYSELNQLGINRLAATSSGLFGDGFEYGTLNFIEPAAIITAALFRLPLNLGDLPERNTPR